jgi:hypothetical protein
MIEMRWVRPPYMTTEAARLQFRVHLPVVDIGGNLCPGDWTEWQSVPTVVVDEEESK